MALRRLSTSSLVLSLSLSLALVGCSGDDGGTASGGETSTSDSSTGSASASSTSTSGASSTSAGSESMTGDTSTSGGTSTTGPSETSGTTAEPTTGTTGEPTTGTTGEPTTGTTGVVDNDGCMPACELLSMCFPYPFDECIADCTDDFNSDPAPECQAAKAEANACLGGLVCDSLMGDNECDPLWNNVDMVCGGGMMMCTPSQMMMGKGCTVDFECGMANFRMQCNQNSCTCLEDGQEVGGCANMDFCALGLDEAVLAANDCCGWNF